MAIEYREIPVPTRYNRRGGSYFCAVPLGLYRVHWAAGGWSYAAIGFGHDGKRWLAPTNWLRAGEIAEWDNGWAQIARLELIVGTDSRSRAQQMEDETDAK